MPDLVWSLIYPGRGSEDRWAPPVAPGSGPADYSIHYDHASKLWYAYDWVTFRETGNVTFADVKTQHEARAWCQARHDARRPDPCREAVRVEAVVGQAETVPADAAPQF